MKSSRRILLTIVFGLTCSLSVAITQAQENKPKTNPKPTSTDDIVRSIQSFAAAFNAGEAKKLAAHFVDDGEYVDDAGTLFKGRDDIEAEFAAFFKTLPGTRLAINVDELRFIGDSMAIEEGTAAVTHASDESVTVSRYIVVHVRKNNRWQIASARDLDSQPASNHDRLKPLEWLIGDWVDESDESTAETSIRWSADGNYIITNFNVNVATVRVMSGTQRIGWDPQRKQIRSWVFDSEGGFGSGFWTGTEAGWIVKATSVLPDGSSGSTTSTYAQTGKDSFRLTLSQRLVAGQPLPDFSIDVVRKPPPVAR
ncbi:MAG: SgcJ/EcaC family oxidoreductase [Planctomycetota bacterium]|nr:SgcJ/EcaC family oxidoreductase [Planctomycetota bacterium]